MKGFARSVVGAASRAPWGVLLLGCVAIVATAETVLLAVGTSFLSSGYNGPRIDRVAFAFGYLPGAILLDVWFVLLIWTAAVPLLSRLTAPGLHVFCGSALLAVVLPVSLTAVNYNAYAILGSMFSVALLSESSTVGPWVMLFESIGEAPDVLWALLAVALCTLVGTLLVRWVERRAGPFPLLAAPPARRLAVALCAASAASAAVMTAAIWSDSPLAYGFRHKLSGTVLSRLIGGLTDVDGDGVGALERPSDPAPLDPYVYPYAVDVPGNGRDENGLVGDHPAGFEVEHSDTAPVALEGCPHVLLVYLESFRTELLGAELHGREITPFLNRLSREGGSSARGYVNAPWTLASRMHLFTGSLVPSPGQTTLVDDFQSRGYTVAWFSGQDDSYGDSARLLGGDRADFFYDARQDMDRRTSRSIEPVSLQVSWKTLTRRALAFLSEADSSQPIFVYLNVVDTHYPYTHSEIDTVLDVEPLERRGIRADRMREVFEAYANTAANVDRAVEQVFDAFRRRIGNATLAVVVTADHGQAFYEYGSLGHGQTLNGIETRVPFIVWGLGGEWPEPIAATDVRGLLLRHLGTASRGARPRFVPDAARGVFQYVPSIEQPRYLALRGLDGGLLYDFAREGAFRLADAEDEGPEAALPLEAARDLIWRWEALQRRALAPDAAAQRPVGSARVAGNEGGRRRDCAQTGHGPSARTDARSGST